MTVTVKSHSKQALLEAGVPRAKIRLLGFNNSEPEYGYEAEFECGCAKEVVEILKRVKK